MVYQQVPDVEHPPQTGAPPALPPEPTPAAPTLPPPPAAAPNPNRPYAGMTAGQRARAQERDRLLKHPESPATPGAPATPGQPGAPTGTTPTWTEGANQLWAQLQGMFLGTDARDNAGARAQLRSSTAGQVKAANEAAYTDAARRGIYRSGITSGQVGANYRAGAQAYTQGVTQLQMKAFDDRVQALKQAQDWLDGLDKRETNQAQIAIAQAQLQLEKENAARAAAAAGRGRAEDGRELIFRGADGKDYVTTVGDFKLAGGLGLDPRSLARPREAATPA